MNPKFPLHLAELEIERLLQHIDRNAARRFLTNPEPPTGFGMFSETKDDAIGRAQMAARSEPYSVERFDVELARLLEMEQEIAVNSRADQIMRGNQTASNSAAVQRPAIGDRA